jgi:hypothetical protein
MKVGNIITFGTSGDFDYDSTCPKATFQSQATTHIPEDSISVGTTLMKVESWIM